MSTLATFFKNIDEFIFAKVDQLQSNPLFQELVAKYEQLDSKLQKVISFTSTILLIFLPLLIVLFLFISNFSLRSEVNAKKEIFQLINDINANKKTLESVEKNVVSPSKVGSRINLKERIINIMNKIGVAPEKVKIKNFAKPSGPTGQISKAEADLEFRDFSTNNLTQLMLQLLQFEKMKISTIEITKNQKKNSIFGTLHLVHFSKVKQ